MMGTAVTIKSDWLVVVQLVRSATPMRSRLCKVIEECRRLVREIKNIRLYLVR